MLLALMGFTLQGFPLESSIFPFQDRLPRIPGTVSLPESAGKDTGG
jgi:hypothetical protein